MEDQNPAPAGTASAAEQASTPEPTPQPSEPQAAEPTPAPTTAEKCCPPINAAEWDKQEKEIKKTFYKTFSPRILYYPFSFAIDVARAKTNAEKKGYKVPENPMILSKDAMFLGQIMVEVEAPEGTQDSNLISFAGKKVYTKVETRHWKEMKQAVIDLKAELPSPAKELYTWYTACPKCIDSAENTYVFIAEL